uniref:Uncharacterized protein n=1 Tax=Anaerobacillus isosaccharinicus TaxID=1532552 RepID=A0A1S2M4I6_9BACI
MEKYKKCGKYLFIFFGIQILSFVAFLILRDDFKWRNDERTIYSFGTVTVVLLSYLIAQVYYLIDLVKKN